MYELLDLYPRDEIIGPAIIMNGTSTCLIEPGCIALITDAGDLEITVVGGLEIFFFEQKASELGVGAGRDGEEEGGRLTKLRLQKKL